MSDPFRSDALQLAERLRHVEDELEEFLREEPTDIPAPSARSTKRRRTVVVGLVLGLLVALVSALLSSRAVEQNDARSASSLERSPELAALESEVSKCSVRLTRGEERMQECRRAIDRKIGWSTKVDVADHPERNETMQYELLPAIQQARKCVDHSFGVDLQLDHGRVARIAPHPDTLTATERACIDNAMRFGRRKDTGSADTVSIAFERFAQVDAGATR